MNDTSLSVARARDKRIVGNERASFERAESVRTVIRVLLKQLVSKDHLARVTLRESTHNGAAATLVALGERKGPWIALSSTTFSCHGQFTLRQTKAGWIVVAYSVQIDRSDAPAGAPSYIRHDYTETAHDNAVKEPWSHVTPGDDNIRIPAPVLSPIELVHLFISAPQWWG
jgi:hypothetical protein